ncbi:MAG: HAMP domain-containing protein, partial [Archangium sp.]
MSPHATSNQSIGIGPKFVFVTAGVSVAIAILLTAVAAGRLRSNLMDSTVSEGKAVAIGFTAAAERASADGATSLQPLLDSFRDADGVGYLYVVDSANNVLAHTFSGEFPQPLLSTNSLQPGELTNGQRAKVQELVEVMIDGKEVKVADVAAPLSGGMHGVLHVGMKHENVGAQVGHLWFSMMLLGLLLVAGGVAAVVLLSRSIVGPLRELTNVAVHIVESGDLTRPIQVSAAGEVGLLARSFGEMVERLRTVTQNLQQ